MAAPAAATGTIRGSLRSSAAAAAVVAVAFVLGILLADPLNRELRITHQEEPIPADGPVVYGAAPDPQPLAPIERIVLPPAEGAVAELYGTAAAGLAHAIRVRTGRTPVIERYAVGAAPIGDAPAIARGAEAGAVRAIIVSDGVTATEPGAVGLLSTGGTIRVRAGTPLAAVHGLAHLTERILAGDGDAQLVALDVEVRPAFEHRFVDLGGVGILPDSAAWAVRDYSHHARAFLHALTPEPPFVDSAAFAEIREQFRDYVRRTAAYGYDGIVFKGFLEFIDFDGLGDGFEVYAADSPYRARHAAVREAFGELFAYADALGMRVILSTDMVALTPPLEDYLRRRFGGIDAEDPALWEVYGIALAELFERLPAVDGLMVRVGETGAVFNVDGWDYRSELHVRTVPALHAMLTAFDAAAGAHGRSVYFRSWSVGIGETGGMHTRPEVYDRIFDGLELPNLVVSTKYTAGDFYSYLPLNPTLLQGEERRMVELQARREYDGFAAVPNYMAPLHQRALRELRSGNPRLRDLWVWTQEGGPTRVSPISLYPFHGFWQLIDADVYAAARLGWDPDADLHAVTRAWVRRSLGDDPQVVGTVTEVLLRSRGPVLDGLYIEPYARRQVHALGLEPPPMLWIFEWDIVTGSSAALSTIYRLSRDDFDAAIAGGRRAVAGVREMRTKVSALDAERATDPDLLRRLERSLAYQEDLLLTLASYREAFLHHYRWLDTGRREAGSQAERALAAYRTQKAAHLASYGDDLDFRAYAFYDADVGLRHAERARAMAWLARGLLGVMLLGILATGLRPRSQVGPRITLWLPIGVVLLAVPTATSVLSSSAVIGAGLVLASFLALLMLQVPRHAAAPTWRATTTGLMAITAVFLVPVAIRGPGFFWLRFWTDELFRTLLVASAFAAAGFLAYAVVAALRGPGACRTADALGRLTIAAGAPLLALATLLQLVGLERVLTALNDELAILPMGLSRILGITTHLGIPVGLPIYVAAAGGVLILAGAGLRLLGSVGGTPRATATIAADPPAVAAPAQSPRP